MKTSSRIGLAACAAALSLVAGAIEFAVPQNVPPLFEPGVTPKSEAGWRNTRRPELKKMLETEVYGHRPVERPPHLAFSAAEPDAVMMDGAAVRKRIRIEYGGRFGTNSFVCTAFIPRAQKPVPSFVFICNRPPAENIDPTRQVKSGFWPAEEIVARGYATVAFHTSDVAPDKQHGNTRGVFAAFEDVERQYRSQTAWGALSAWAILREIRNFLSGRDFMEVETPMLVENAGGAAARPFITHYNALGEDRKLRISLELYLKRLIVGGMERVYEIGRVFRNEGTDPRHNPEFTLMELYQAYTDYEGMMELTESMFRYLAQTVCGTTQITYGDKVIDLGKPFKRLTMSDAVKEYAGVDFETIESAEAAVALAKEKGLEIEAGHDTKGDILNLFFEEFCEDKMIQPTFIMDHPVEISPLTKRKPSDPSKVERFELYINGWEMCNAYSELNDPIDQRERFKAQDALAAAGDEEANHTDEDFLNAMEIGMPPTGGIGYGIDRLCMLLTNAPSIRDVLLWPALKSLDPNARKSSEEQEESTGFFTPNNKIDFSNVKIEPLFEENVDFETFSKSDFRAVKVKNCVAVPKSKKLLQFTLDDGTGTDRTILSGIHAYYEPEELIGKTLVAITNLPPRAMMGIESCGMLLSAVNNKKDSEEEELHLLMVDNHIPAGAKLY